MCLTLLKKKKNSHQQFASDSLIQEEIEEGHKFVDESLNQLYDTNPNNIGVRIKRIKERLKKLLYGKVN